MILVVPFPYNITFVLLDEVFPFKFLRCMWLVFMKGKLFLSKRTCCFVLDGNGFKTSTMRLGADAIVFSRSTRSGYIFILCILVVGGF